MNGSELRELVADDPLLADGGVGTALIERGAVAIDDCIEVLNLDRPDEVASVHRAFVDAGSKLVETNTFGANRFALAKHGFEARVAEINAAGVELAKRAGVLVAGSVGPLRVRLAPYGRVRRSVARTRVFWKNDGTARVQAYLLPIHYKTRQCWQPPLTTRCRSIRTIGAGSGREETPGRRRSDRQAGA